MNLAVMMAVVALILIGIAVAVANADSGMPDAPRDLPDIGIPADREMTPEDVDALRFSMAPRGYRMGEVDDAMARLREELVGRDAEIERLRNPSTAGEQSEVGRLDVGRLDEGQLEDGPLEVAQPEDTLDIRAETDADQHQTATDTHG